MKPLKELIEEKATQDKPGYITQEFQDYGYRLAVELGDLKRKAFYIKLAKEEDRRILEEARIFTKGYYGAKSKAKIFMWKLKELRSQQTEKPQWG